MNKIFYMLNTNNGDFMKEKQIIHCTVYDCTFCNDIENFCQLNEIKVCHSVKKSKKEATMCDSFKKRI